LRVQPLGQAAVQLGGAGLQLAGGGGFLQRGAPYVFGTWSYTAQSQVKSFQRPPSSVTMCTQSSVPKLFEGLLTLHGETPVGGGALPEGLPKSAYFCLWWGEKIYKYFLRFFKPHRASIGIVGAQHNPGGVIPAEFEANPEVQINPLYTGHRLLNQFYYEKKIPPVCSKRLR
jgi:hypothetical protein